MKENIAAVVVGDSDYKFLVDLRAYMDEKVGTLEFPEELLKKIMINNNKDKGEQYVEDNFAKSLVELKWHLIKEQLVKAHDVKIDQNDVKAAAIEATRYQFAQYGMNNIPNEYLENYAKEMLKNQDQVNGLIERCTDQKLTAALKNVVTLNHKAISQADFAKMFD